ncbi:MAG: 3-isopropylmalate dehydratase [Nitrospirae bacterium RIFCSPLOWO2_02_42_7]|nr:MAG: 3-isopropylmalate dehydratase [Nitrospirae bacterium RIFCSPLOWO2_02_42_7]
MGMTITEKILARHAGKKTVSPGDNVWVDVDVLMTHDVCGPGTIEIFKREFGRDARVWDREKVVIIPDHYIFTEDIYARRNIDILREFVIEQGIKHFYDVGSPEYKGVCHVALSEEGHTRPGEVLFGTDSHTCTAGAFGEFATGIGNTDAAFIMGTGMLWVKVPPTVKFIFNGEMPAYLMAKDLILHIIGDIGVDGATYKAMEFEGEGISMLSVEERMTLCNMAIEAGGKSGIIAADDKTLAFVKQRSKKGFEVVYGDDDAGYESVRVYNLQDLEPVVAKPHSPDNKALVSEVKGTKIDRCYIGSCTGGKLTDFRAAAMILRKNHVKIETYIVPATTEVEKRLKEEMINGDSLYTIFEKAGAKISDNASCAACLGGPPDTFGRLTGDEVCISTTNRNFPGRMGSKQSQVYLASPLTAAASAIRGEITDPRDLEE